jgi:hypothetical protein
MRLKAVLYGIAMLGVVLLSYPAWGAEKDKAPEPDPNQILRQMCDYLTSLKQFSFRAEVTDDQVYQGGKKLQYGFDLEALVRRPDKLRVNAQGDLVNKQFFYDGKTITLYETAKNLYATMEVPGDLDGALAKAHRDFGLRVALADLASSHLYDLVTKEARSSLYVGLHRVRGVKCHHLAFDEPKVHVQMWIDAGDQPLLRKLIITQKQLEGSPQWSAHFTDWQVSPQLPDSLFTFEPPPGAEKIKFVPVLKTTGPKAAPERSKQKGGKS